MTMLPYRHPGMEEYYDITNCGINTNREILSFIRSVANKENWYGDFNNQWFAKRHCKDWARDILKKLESELDVVP